MGMKDMFDSLRIIFLKSSIFSTFTFVLIILALLFADTIIYNGSSDHHQLQTQISAEEIKVKSLTDEIFTETDEKFVRPESKFKHVEESELFESSDLSTKFDLRVKEFFRRNECKVKFFMTWIGPADSYREREFFGLETLFQTNPQSCLIIMSKSMDTVYGDKILEPLIGCGFRVLAVTPDLWGLFKKTPAETWLKEIRNGSRDPGQIPLAQNLSNLMRLAALYKYGGVYLDTDFVILRDFSVLKNVIGAQSVDIKGNWTRLNNAVLVFNRKHPLVHKFMEEFASTFDGNRWGHNGPYLVLALQYSVGLGLLKMSTPPVQANSMGNCKEYKPECISHGQEILFYTAMPLIAFGMAGHLTSFNICLDKAATVIPTQPREEQKNKIWRLCTVTEVEETKVIVRMIPVWMTFILCGVVSALGITFFVEQLENLDQKVWSLRFPP
ncbi:uncharacterized protein [Primulina huaijiensis]|uniref:uncharacterized protein n=1 Tax=Primulina huaijiensis TaxID=1492673 RepID=UPI003CC71E4C